MRLIEINGIVYNFAETEIDRLDSLQKKVDNAKGETAIFTARAAYNRALRAMWEIKEPLGEIYLKVNIQ